MCTSAIVVQPRWAELLPVWFNSCGRQLPRQPRNLLKSCLSAITQSTMALL